MTNDTDHTGLEQSARDATSFFPEKLFVEYTALRSMDDEKLYAFLRHGPLEDGDYVCVDEDPDELDAPPSPRLEAIAAIVNLFPALIAEVQERRDQVDKLQQWIDEINVALGGLGINLQEDRLKAIATLTAQLEGARGALKPFAKEGARIPARGQDDVRYEAGCDEDACPIYSLFTVGDLRAAASILQKGESDGGQCRVCAASIGIGELCEGCANGNDPFYVADNAGKDLR